jgi:hypothetical protein
MSTIDFRHTCLVEVTIAGVPAFDLQIYGLRASDLEDDHLRLDVVLGALSRRGINPDNSFIRAGMPRADSVHARKTRKFQ